MRGSRQRSNKYAKKIRGLILPGQKQRKTATIKREVDIERMIEQLVGPTLLRGHYMIFAKQINKVLRKFKGPTLQTEVEILQNTWITRGLDETILGTIKTWFGVAPAAAPPVPGSVTLRPNSTTYNPCPCCRYWDTSCSSLNLHLAVDEDPPDEDSSYVSSRGCACPPFGCTTGYCTYRLGLPASGIPPGAIITNVTHYMRFKQEAVGVGEARLGLYTNGNYDWDDFKHPGVSYVTYSKSWPNNPITGNPWTVTEINVLELAGTTKGSLWFGFYLFCRTTQHYVVVDYLA